jgi:exosortase
MLVAALFGILYFPTFVNLAKLWQKDPNYSHGWLILPISGVLAGLALRRQGWPERGQWLLGSAYALVGCLVHSAAQVTAWPPLDFFALVFTFRGLALAAGGREWAAGFTFPTLFLFFMFPLPVTWTSYAALWLQDWVSRISGAVLDLLFVCHQRGTALHIAGLSEPLVVAEECSGLRQIVVFVALGTLLGYVSQRPVLFRILLVLTAVPVALLANVARVILMAMGAVWFGTDWMHGWLHDTPALFSLPFGLLLFLGVWRLLSAFWPSPAAKGVPA